MSNQNDKPIFDPKDPRYDQTGQYPIDEDGWQIVRPLSSLYPGGPFTAKVVNPQTTYYYVEDNIASPEYNNYLKRLYYIYQFGMLNAKTTETILLPDTDKDKVRLYLLRYLNDPQWSDAAQDGTVYLDVIFKNDPSEYRNQYPGFYS